jgi:hypothetical protein
MTDAQRPHYQSDLAACKRDLVPRLEAIGFGLPERMRAGSDWWYEDWEYAMYIYDLYKRFQAVDDRLPYIA